MHPLGGWFFVLDVTRGLKRRKFYLFGEIATINRLSHLSSIFLIWEWYVVLSRRSFPAFFFTEVDIF